MTHKSLLPIFLLTLAPLAACVSPDPAARLSPSGTRTLPATAEKPTPSRQPTSPPGSDPEAPQSAFPPTDCPPRLESVPQDARGSIILWEDGTLKLVDLPKLDAKDLTDASSGPPQDAYYADFVSPDGLRFAFTTESKNTGIGDIVRRLHVVDATGKNAFPPLWHPGWGTVVGWSIDHMIILTDESHADGTMTVVDPLTGAAQSLEARMPNLNLHDPPIWYRGTPAALYDPTLSRAIYKSYPDFVLWDSTTGTVLAQLDAGGEQIPVWSPSGSQVVLTTSSLDNGVHDEFLLMSKDGEVTPLTELSGLLDAAYVLLSPPRWSPDGLRIAFWIGIQESEDAHPLNRFVVLDPLTGALTDYCVQDDGYSIPRWSPDGRFVALHQGLIVDTQAPGVYQTGIHGVPQGWLAAPQPPGPS